eukprot:3186611-Amphidinium_carterae.1
MVAMLWEGCRGRCQPSTRTSPCCQQLALHRCLAKATSRSPNGGRALQLALSGVAKPIPLHRGLLTLRVLLAVLCCRFVPRVSYPQRPCPRGQGTQFTLITGRLLAMRCITSRSRGIQSTPHWFPLELQVLNDYRVSAASKSNCGCLHVSLGDVGDLHLKRAMQQHLKRCNFQTILAFISEFVQQV